MPLANATAKQLLDRPNGTPTLTEIKVDSKKPWHAPGQEPPAYAVRTHALRQKFSRWEPTKKLSREAMDVVRSLHKAQPDTFTAPVLAERFRVSREAMHRILRAKWQPDEERLEQIHASKREKDAEYWKEKDRAEKDEMDALRTEWRARQTNQQPARPHGASTRPKLSPSRFKRGARGGDKGRQVERPRREGYRT